jgi:hypothetical protein
LGDLEDIEEQVEEEEEEGEEHSLAIEIDDTAKIDFRPQGFDLERSLAYTR